MARRGKDTEQLVALLEAALGEEDRVDVQSPDYIPDRDTGRKREVDVAVRIKSGTHQVLIILECRDRQNVEDVTWIEQLASKRSSVGADKAIAVSTSGFSEPARRKARACMIELRTLQEFKGISAQTLLEAFPIPVALHEVINAKTTIHVAPDDDRAYYADLAAVKARQGTRPLFEAEFKLTDPVIFSRDNSIGMSFLELLGRAPMVDDVFRAQQDGEWIPTVGVFGDPEQALFIEYPQGQKRLLALEGEIQVAITEDSVNPHSMHVYADERGNIAGAATYTWNPGRGDFKFRAVFGKD